MEIHTITTPFFLRTTVNCYLVRSDTGFVLIDTALAGKRALIEKEIKRLGCKPGDLKLIVLTHGDFDHSGNAAYFRQKFGAKITMHEADRGMVELGDMFWNRKTSGRLVRLLLSLFSRLNKEDRFSPDFYIKEGDNLSEYGFDVKVIELPGHSKGSVGLITEDGDLFCGDLLANVDEPNVWSIIDDSEAANASVEKISDMELKTVYPGHGEPFPMRIFLKGRDAAT